MVRWNITDPMADVDTAWSTYNNTRKNSIWVIDSDECF